MPRSQLRPKPPINLHQHHHHSHLSHHNHSSAAGIAALAANAVLAGNLTHPANAAFTRRQRLRWTLPPPPSPPQIPPGGSSHHRLYRPRPHRHRRNRHDYAKSGGRRYRGSVHAELLLLGERNCYGSGRAKELPEGAAAGVRVRALGDYSWGSGGVKEGARGGVAGGRVTAGADRRRDERFCDRRGERRHGQGQDQVLPAWRTPALPEGGRRHYQRGRAPLLAQGTTVSATGGDGAGVPGGHKHHHHDHRRPRRYHRCNRCPCSVCYMRLSCKGSGYVGPNTSSTTTPG